MLGLACSTADEWRATPRAALRADVLGCWRLSGMTDEPTPELVQLDSSADTLDGGLGQRVVRRLGASGQRIVTDGEGHEFVDHWAADSASDSIRLVLGHRYNFYGSHWVLASTRAGGAPDTLRGRALAFTDVPQETPYPIRPVAAVRVPCPATMDSTPND
ncbi:MAG: hypothetical protein LCH84_06530 [Gemmatimonadetes bacterium]|nr:hypothetical protein [Gemmatimonadota bacterium]